MKMLGGLRSVDIVQLYNEFEKRLTEKSHCIKRQTFNA
jgi:hypothetical protein